MFSNRMRNAPQEKDQVEGPFWISLSDMMISTMVIFLIMAVVTVIVMNRHLSLLGDDGSKYYARQVEIEQFANVLKVKSEEVSIKPRISTVKDVIRIDLGESVNFVSGSSDISKDGRKFLLEYIPKLLEVMRSDLGQKWLKHIVVEGFTDSDGSYLFNLDLSLKRSRQVVCSLFEQNEKGEYFLPIDDLNMVRDLFLVGGYSFNSVQSSKARSRRVELKLEFWELEEKERFDRTKVDLKGRDFGKCH